MVLPSSSVTIALLVSFLKPYCPLKVLPLPLKIDVFTLFTLTLNIASTAFLISYEFEFLETINEYWLNCCKLVDFSVVNGFLIMP